MILDIETSEFVLGKIDIRKLKLYTIAVKINEYPVFLSH